MMGLLLRGEPIKSLLKVCDVETNLILSPPTLYSSHIIISFILEEGSPRSRTPEE